VVCGGVLVLGGDITTDILDIQQSFCYRSKSLICQIAAICWHCQLAQYKSVHYCRRSVSCIVS